MCYPSPIPQAKKVVKIRHGGGGKKVVKNGCGGQKKVVVNQGGGQGAFVSKPA